MKGIEGIAESALVLYLVKVAVQGLLSWIKKRKDKKPFKKAFVDIAKVYQELNDLMAVTGAGRILLLRSHNGGGKPKLGKPLYSTAEYEVCSNGSRSIKKDWVGESLDEHYIKMLLKVMTEGEVTLKLGELGDTLLGRIYFNSHVLSSRVFRIHEDEKSFYYLSVNFNDPKDIDDPNFKEICRPYVTRLRKLFNDQRE